MSREQERQKELSNVEYWDNRYARQANPQNKPIGTIKDDSSDDSDDDDDEYEWFRKFSDLEPFLKAQIPPPASACFIIHLGCGTSTLTADLFHLGYTRQLSVDFSSVVIEEMQKTHAAHPELVWQKIDVRHMDEIESGKFDIAIDKGTLDSMIYGSPWDPEEESKKNVKSYVDEVARILADGGKWLYITFRQPHFLRPLLTREGIWELTVHSLTGPSDSFEYFGYVMTKPEKLESEEIPLETENVMLESEDVVLETEDVQLEDDDINLETGDVSLEIDDPTLGRDDVNPRSKDKELEGAAVESQTETQSLREEKPEQQNVK